MFPMFSATEQICDYWDKLEVSKHPRGGGAKAIYLSASHILLSEPGKQARWTVIGGRFRSSLKYKPRARSPKPTLQVSRSGEEPTHTHPGLQLPAHPQPCPEEMLRPRLQPPPLPGLAPARPPGGHSRGHQYLSLGPVHAARATMAAAWPAPAWQARPGVARGAQLHRFPLREEPGAARTRQSPLGPQRPRPEPPESGLRSDLASTPLRMCYWNAARP